MNKQMKDRSGCGRFLLLWAGSMISQIGRPPSGWGSMSSIRPAVRAEWRW